jgi:two-component system, LuxR family, sensor kinase FixL
LNQPLTSILSNAQAAQRFLAKSTLDIVEMREILSDIVSEDRRAGEIIRHLRMLLSPAEGARQITDVNELLAETMPLLNGEFASQHVSVSMELAPSLPLIMADRVQLQQVIINLLINGCEAMRDVPGRHGKLVVRTECAKDQGVSVSVIDHGCGISAEALPRVFESFFTTKAGGMGLGLSVCQSIIATHGGEIWAENNAEGGASFRFSLPASEPEAG